MKKSIFLLLPLLISPQSASAQGCNPGCENTLRARGAAPWVIQAQCCPNAAAASSSQAAIGNQCVTPSAGRCPLYQGGTVGTGCFCPSQSGPVAGTIQ